MSQPTTNKRPGFTDQELDQARRNLDLAFDVSGLTGGGGIICPACREPHAKGKFKLNAERGTYVCFKAKAHGLDLATGDSIELMMKLAGYSFPDAVNTLLGRPIKGTPAPVVREPLVHRFAEPEFVAVIDPVMLAEVLHHSGPEGLAAAQEYYGRWHIAPRAVERAGARVILNPRQLQSELLRKYGEERVIATGLAKRATGKDGSEYLRWMFKDTYNVVEPQITPAGLVVGMQFRPSPEHMSKVAAHKAYAKAKSKAEEAGKVYNGPEVPYVPSFLSLRGAKARLEEGARGANGEELIESLVGVGLPYIWELTSNTEFMQKHPGGAEIYVVEGFKDVPASYTMGCVAFGIPGAGHRPSAKVCALLAKHTILVALDGDEAGDAGTKELIEYLRSQGVERVRPVEMPRSLDTTDVLVRRWARTGCACATCEDWRKNHPE